MFDKREEWRAALPPRGGAAIIFASRVVHFAAYYESFAHIAHIALNDSGMAVATDHGSHHLIAASFFRSTRLIHSCNSAGSSFCNSTWTK